MLAKIGTGGMGDVFLASQRGAVDFNRLVVVKRIHNRHVQHTEENTRMFMNEASLVASLNHPHIVKIFDFYMAADSVSIVMEYVEGETLKFIGSICNRNKRRIPFGITSRLILDACDALNYAHHSTSPTGAARTVIHRDIGLHNLMLDSNGYLKVIDFGIAKSDIQQDKTVPGLVKGTPAYMAPDLFTSASPDHRIDIYALGLCLYELATQSRAFHFSKNASLAEIMNEITTRELKAPSLIQSDLPPGFDEVLFKAIEKNPDNRYQTVEAFATDLKMVADRQLYTGAEVKGWFTTLFAKRIDERRSFGARLLENSRNARPGMPTSTMNVPDAGFQTSSMSRVTQQDMAPQVTNVTQVVMDRSHIYKIVGAMFLFILAAVTVLYVVAFRGREVPQDAKQAQLAQVVLTDNVEVHSTPTDAILSVDGKELGMIGEAGLAFRVAPNVEHSLVISQKGFRDFSLRFAGPVDGVKQISASLVPLEEDDDVAAGETSHRHRRKKRNDDNLSDDASDDLENQELDSEEVEVEADEAGSMESAPVQHSSGRKPQSVGTSVKRASSDASGNASVNKNAAGNTEKSSSSTSIDEGSASDGGRLIPLPDDERPIRRTPVVDD